MHITYNVAPRYSAGSPAMVDRKTALGVAEDEIDGHGAALQGIYGIPQRDLARSKGLSGIVTEVAHYSTYTITEDLITGERIDSRKKTLKQISGLIDCPHCGGSGHVRG